MVSNTQCLVARSLHTPVALARGSEDAYPPVQVRCIGAAAAFLAALSWTVQAPADPPKLSPKEVVERIVTRDTHCANVSEDTLKLYDEVRATPKDYAPIVSRELRLPNASALFLEPLNSKRLSLAIGLLAALGKPEGEDLLVQLYKQVRDLQVVAARSSTGTAPAESDRQKVHDDLRSIRWAALQAAIEMKTDRLIDNCLDEISEAEYTLQLDMLVYFRETAVGNQRVFTKLCSLYTDRESELRGDPALGSALQAIWKDPCSATPPARP